MFKPKPTYDDLLDVSNVLKQSIDNQNEVAKNLMGRIEFLSARIDILERRVERAAQ